MRRITGGCVGRVIAGSVMGALAFALIVLFELTGSVRFPGGTVAALSVAAIGVVLIAALSHSARRAWGSLCMLDGISSVALAGISFQARGQPLWPSDLGYEHDLGRAIESWLRHEIGTGAAYFGTAIVSAAVLLALSYFLLRSHDGRHRDAP